MEQIISKEEFDKFIKIEGQIRGVAFKTEEKFILKEEGEKGLKKLEEEMEKVGYSYSRIKTMNFYPLGLQAISLLIIKRLFAYDNEKFQELGRFKPKVSPILARIFLKYLISFEEAVKGLPRMWTGHYTVGRLRVVEHNKEKKYVLLRIKDFCLHPLLCQVLIGYFTEALQMILRGTKANGKETKCVHRGDEYHEFLVKW